MKATGRYFAWAVLAAGLMAGPALAQDDSSSPAARCDALAANPFDPTVPAGTGVGFNDVDAPAAIAACSDAAAADPQNSKLVYQLGRAYDVAEQFDEAIARYRAAADMGNALAINSLGTLYEGGYGLEVDAAEAARLYQQAADGGLVVAKENLAKLYEEGRGVEQDYARAIALYREAETAGSAYSSGSLGWLAENGFGMPQDDAEAVRLYRIAADAGEAFAQHNLGVMYGNGRGGLEKDEVEAARYYTLAAEQNWPLALQSLGWAYSHGAGVDKDIAQAESFFRRAIESGDARVQGDATNDLAWMYATEAMKLEEAEALSREAVAIKPEAANYLDTLAWILHLRDKDAEALPLAEKAVALDAKDAVLSEHLAEIRASLGK